MSSDDSESSYDDKVDSSFSTSEKAKPRRSVGVTSNKPSSLLERSQVDRDSLSSEEKKAKRKPKKPRAVVSAKRNPSSKRTKPPPVVLLDCSDDDDDSSHSVLHGNKAKAKSVPSSRRKAAAVVVAAKKYGRKKATKYVLELSDNDDDDSNSDQKKFPAAAAKAKNKPAANPKDKVSIAEAAMLDDDDDDNDDDDDDSSFQSMELDVAPKKQRPLTKKTTAERIKVVELSNGDSSDGKVAVKANKKSTGPTTARIAKKVDDGDPSTEDVVGPSKLPVQSEAAAPNTKRKSVSKNVTLEDYDAYDIVLPPNLMHSCSNSGECTVLVQIDPNDAYNLDFTGAVGVVGRMEADDDNRGKRKDSGTVGGEKKRNPKHSFALV
jgi:hypothetical protein